MAPKCSLSCRFSEHEKNPSILVENVGRDDLDLSDRWGGRGTYVAASRWRISCPDKKPARSTPWGSRFTSLSSNLRGASAVLTARAKQLRVGESTSRIISQLRRSMVDTSAPGQSPLPRAPSLPSQHLFNESDVDPFEDVSDQPESEDERCNVADKPSRLHASQSWTQDCM
ncbi:hypothetical protein PRIC1_009162 [Phytophthora ramorum]